jgi:peroxiredoxin
MMGFTIEVGKLAPAFRLPGVDERDWALEDFAKCRIVVLVFSCNHCPFVVGSEERMLAFQHDFGSRGVQLVAINSNETDNHPGDSFEKMVERAKELSFSFPYLRDETQDVAKAYGAQRTPHFFVLDEKRVVRYTGRMDDNPRDASKATTRELRDAVEEVLAGVAVSVPVTEAIGCNVKWWGREEHWMPADACDFV